METFAEFVTEFVQYILTTYTSELIVGVIASVIGGWIANTVTESRLRSVPKKQVQKFGAIINTAKMQGSYNAVENGKTIVRARNILREMFIEISDLLNSDLEDLADLLEEFDKLNAHPQQTSKKEMQALENRINEKITIIANTWELNRYKLEKALDIALVRLGVYAPK